MTDFIDLNAKRWESKTSVEEHKPLDALKAVIRDIEAGNITPDHVIIAVGWTTESGGSCSTYYQAGDFTAHAQHGLLWVIQQQMREG